MGINHRKTLQEVAGRLKELREHLNYSRKEMAARLGVTRNGYTKNENGDTLPGIPSLRRLSRDLDISMDWLLFNRGPMYFPEKLPEEPEPPKEEIKEEPPEKEEENKAPRIEEIMPDVRELLDHMEKDPLFRHKVLLDFYTYKKETEKAEESPITESDS